MIIQLDLFDSPEICTLKHRIIELEIDNKKSSAEIKKLKKQVKELIERLNEIEYGLSNLTY